MKFYDFVKRVFDAVNAFFGIIIFSPLLIIISLLVVTTSKGPILFLDKRVGKNGVELKVYKFRTMCADAESNIEKYLSDNEKERWEKERKLDCDPRITKLGNILRKTSLDELPQLFNILFGQMSFIGPRPITKKELELNFTKEEANTYVSAKPGLISEWGVNGRNDITYENHQRQNIELSYFKKKSLLHDLSLFFKAIPTVISGKGAR